MENKDDLHDSSDLPTLGPGHMLANAVALYQNVDQLLTNLSQKLQQTYNGRENPWTARVQAVRPKDIVKEHIIGIVGATGACKSAFINVLLDVGRLVPTNCMQARTAAIIEIAFSWSPLHDFRSVVEFTSREKWRSELDAFVKYFVNASPEDQNFAAAIAYAKIAAVETDLTRDEIFGCTAEELMDRADLSILGSTLDINASTSCDTYEQLRKYVKSKEKFPGSAENRERTSQTFRM